MESSRADKRHQLEFKNMKELNDSRYAEARNGRTQITSNEIPKTSRALVGDRRSSFDLLIAGIDKSGGHPMAFRRNEGTLVPAHHVYQILRRQRGGSDAPTLGKETICSKQPFICGAVA